MSVTAHFGEHYNARGLTPEVIADSFVAPHQFWSVSVHGNSVLVGPRGSGKTTLLRMLDPRALNRWLDLSKSMPPEGWLSPQYVGIFVPIDTAWVSSLTNAVERSGQVEQDRLYLAIYSLSVAKCLTDVMRWRLSDASAGSQLHADRSIETELARHLGEVFSIGSSMRSLLELHIELTKKILALPSRWRDTPELSRSGLIAGLENPLASAAAACDVFNTLANEADRKWSLLCDELEIAPLAIRKLLFSGLRAISSPLLLKMALTPKEQIGPIDASESPLPANDYEVVSLSYPTREEGAPEKERQKFCIALWKSLVEEHGGDLCHLLENPCRAFEDPQKISTRKVSAVRSVHDLESKFGVTFRSLASKDESFRKYLDKKQIHIDDLDKNDQAKRDSVIRKVRPIVEVRDHYLRLNSDGELVRISRRSANLYCGAKRVFAVSEGHPRWLKYTLGAMLTRVVATYPHLRLTDQNRELRYAVQRTEARLKALPVEIVSSEELVHKLGEFFSSQVLDVQFRADPVLSFVVDTNISDGVENAVAQALYLGALVPLQGDVFNLFTRGLQGRRFRLSNWLAPAFSLPLMTGKANNLSAILSGQKKDYVYPVQQVQFPLGLSE